MTVISWLKRTFGDRSGRSDGPRYGEAFTTDLTVTRLEERRVLTAPTLDVIADPAAINEDAGEQTINLTGITDADGDTQELQVTAVSDTPGLIPNPTVTYTSNNNFGSLKYTPVANQSGTAIITVTVTDGGTDGLIATAGDNETFQRQFTVQVDPVNDDAPTLDAIANPAAINEDAGEQTINLTGITDGDVDTQELQVTAVSDTPGLIPNPTVTYTSNNNFGSLKYTPVANQSGTATITVTVTDGGADNLLATAGDNQTFQRQFTVQVDPVNDDAPTLDAIANPAAINEDAGEQTINLTGITDADGDTQELQVTAVSDTPGLIPNPTVTYTSNNNFGSLKYTPVANQSGTAIITVTVTDGGTDGLIATAGDNQTFQRQFTVQVDPVNDDAPTLDAIPNPAPINEDAGAQTINLTGITDGDVNTQELQITATSNQPGLIPNPTVTYTSNNTTGKLKYTPVANQSGTATITVTVTDGGLDGLLATAGDNQTFQRTFDVQVNSVNNDPPTLDAIPNPAAINEDAGEQTINLTGITDGDVNTQELQITATSNKTGLIPNPTAFYTSNNTTGQLKYTPVADQSGTATITVTVTDGGADGLLATAGDNQTFQQQFTVQVNAVNDDPPTLDAIANPAPINEDAGQQTINLTGITDGDVDTQELQITATSNSTGLIPNPTVIYTSNNTTGSLKYTPVADQSGTATITVTVTDGGADGLLATPGDNQTFQRTFDVQVNPVNNDPPTLDAIPNPAAINEDAPEQTINLTGITDGDVDMQELQITAVSNKPGLIPNPTVFYTSNNTTGQLKYTPVADQSGTATITVTVTDGGLDNLLATPGDNQTFQRQFTVQVNAVNDDPPTLDAIPNPAPILEDAAEQTINLSGITDGDVDTQELQITATSNLPGLIPNPTVFYTSNNTTGQLKYTPVADQSGTATITVTVTDGGADNMLATPGDNQTFQRTFDVQVLAVNDPPTLNAIPNPAPINEDAPEQTINLSGITDGDFDTQQLQITAVSDTPGVIPNPTVFYTSNNTTGQLKYTPVANQSGTATITVTVTDGGLDNLLATPGDNATFQRQFTVQVDPVNDDPPTLDAIANPAAILEDAGEQTINLTGITDGDLNTQQLMVTATSNTPGLLPNPTVVYTSNNATGQLKYTPVADQNGTAIITVMVTDGGLNNILGDADDQTFVRQFSVQVDPVNDAPVITGLLLQDTQVDEGSPFGLRGSFIDVDDGDVHTVIVSWGDGTVSTSANGGVTLDQPHKRFSATHIYVDDNPTNTAADIANVTVTVTDGIANDQEVNPITVRDVAPTFVKASATDVTAVGETTVSGTIQDPGIADGQSVVIIWGDDSPPQFVPIAMSNGVGSFSASHLFFGNPDRTNQAAPIPILIMVTDDDGLSSEILVKAGVPGNGLATPILNVTPTVPPLSFATVAQTEIPAEVQSAPEIVQFITFESGPSGPTETGLVRVELRVVSPDGTEGEGITLNDENTRAEEILKDLPRIFKSLPDDHYRIYLVREDGSERLVLNVILRRNKQIDQNESGSENSGAKKTLPKLPQAKKPKVHESSEKTDTPTRKQTTQRPLDLRDLKPANDDVPLKSGPQLLPPLPDDLTPIAVPLGDQAAAMVPVETEAGGSESAEMAGVGLAAWLGATGRLRWQQKVEETMSQYGQSGLAERRRRLARLRQTEPTNPLN